MPRPTARASRSQSGERERTRAVLLTMGQYDDLPAVDGLTEMFGRGVYHCPYCHGFEARDVPLAVLGNDMFAAPLALHLRMRISDDVVLCTNGPAELDEEQWNKLTRCGVTVLEDPVARVEGHADAFERVVFASGATLARGGLFVRAPLRQHSDLAAGLGCELRDDGTVRINDFHQTTVPGVYAAGDITRPESYPVPIGQAIVAAADGAKAAIWLDQELLAADIEARIQPAETLSPFRGKPHART
ncbi:MAG: NAD(P)/FAD-dependent oxidoreductase [Pseudonocardiaceae bacterium]